MRRKKLPRIYLIVLKKIAVIFFILCGIIICVSFTRDPADTYTKKLRKLYSKPPSKWPAPDVDPTVKWAELGIIPEPPVFAGSDSLGAIVDLGKALFFDPRLSSSGKISCATCHQPELNWTDGKTKSIGHEGATSKRNAPTIQNAWFYKRLFWDGRAKDLQDQAFAPINSESEMHNEMHEVMITMNRLKSYKALFKKAFGDDEISPDRLTYAISIFEKTITSRKTRFDQFVESDKQALTDGELRGLHIFRTQARCMNCHHGPMFTDNMFHNSGIVPYNPKDKGLYIATHNDNDTGKFKTPSLRDVTRTRPWMHDGSISDLNEIVGLYAKGPSHPADHLLRPFSLSGKDAADLLAFLEAISAAPVDFVKPRLP